MSGSKTAHDSATPAHGQQVISAVAFIHRIEDGVHKVFLPKRADTKAFLPGVYEMPGGHIDFDEDIVTGLKREIKEEFDMDVSIGDPFACFTYVNKVKGSHSVEVVYFGQFTGEVDIKLDPEDHSEYSWFSKEELCANLNILRPSAESMAQSVDKLSLDQDHEVKSILKGFGILEGKNPDLG